MRAVHAVVLATKALAAGKAAANLFLELLFCNSLMDLCVGTRQPVLDRELAWSEPSLLAVVVDLGRSRLDGVGPM